MKLRPYQQKAIDSTYAYWKQKKGNHPIIEMPTGSGKSVVIATIIRDYSHYGFRVLMLTHQKELVEQNFEKLKAIDSNLDIGIYSAGLNKKQLHNKIVCASIQSISDKMLDTDSFDLVVIDECQRCAIDDDGQYQKCFKDILLKNPRCRFLGLSATPYRYDTGYLHEHKDIIFDGISYAVSVTELLNGGYLCPLIPKPMSGADMSKFVDDDDSEVYDNEELLNKIADEFIETFESRNKAVIFVSNVNNAKLLKESMNDKGFHDVDILSGDISNSKRDKMLKDYADNELNCIINVNCLDSDTEILCLDGWKKHDEISYDDEVANYNLDGSIFFKKPKNIIKRYKKDDERMVSIKGRTTDIRVSEEHRMLRFYGCGNKKIEVALAKDLDKYHTFVYPASGSFDGYDITIKDRIISEKDFNRRVIRRSHTYRKYSGYSMNESKQLAKNNLIREYSKKYTQPKDLSISDCKLIGLWLGDGTKSCGRYSITQSFAYPKIIEWIRSLLKESNIYYNESFYYNKHKGYNNSITFNLPRGTGGNKQYIENGIYRLEPYLDKDGSKYLWGLNDAQFSAFLEGLWMADGSHGDCEEFNTESHRNIIVSANKKMCDMLQSLAVCHGYKMQVSKNGRPTKDNHNQQYKMTFNNISNKKIARDISLDNGKHKEILWCVENHSSYIVTRRNGKVAIMGNCLTTGWDCPDIDLVVMARATESTSLMVQCYGRGMRLSPKKTNCIVLDYGDNIKRHGKIDSIKPVFKISRDVDKSDDEEVKKKSCPQCEAKLSLGVKECPDCGYMFGSNKINLKDKFYSGSIIGADDFVSVNIDSYRWVGNRLTVFSEFNIYHYTSSNGDIGKEPIECKVDKYNNILGVAFR